jgi:pimeloyl-ACP methyl ester carboxylesterase
VFGLATACATARHEALPVLEFSAIEAPAEPKWARVGELNVAYIDEGSGPLIVLLHGLGEHVGYWSENLEGLVQAGVRVVAPDLPGFGRSDKPPGDYAMAWQAAVVAGLLDAVAPGEQAVLVGHSMGAQIALRFALAWPERTAGLVLLAPAGLERFDAREAAFIKRYTSTRTYAGLDEGQLRAHFQKNLFARWSAVAERHLAERVRLKGATAFAPYLYAVVQSIHAMLDGPVWPELHDLRVPVRVLLGGADRLVPNPLLHGGGTAWMERVTRELLPEARVEVADGVGHMVQIEAPDVTERFILGAVDRGGRGH